MLNKLTKFVREQQMVQPGDTVVCALSGGPDSIAMTFAFYLLKEKLGIHLEAAHFNHLYRGEEGYRDEQFVRDFCSGYGIPLHVGSGQVVPGEKGLEAAARDARYTFLQTLPGKIATAHTADDNAETVLMHLIRGTGLKGLGGISPARNNLIRPMLHVTRAEVEAFLAEYAVDYIHDSSNSTDEFLRNRLRHHVMPLLKAENPKLSQNLSAMALRLREDEQALSDLSRLDQPEVEKLRAMAPSVRARALEDFLKSSGVREPEATHIRLLESLVFSDNPSARANFPGGITIGRNYGLLEVISEMPAPAVQFACTPATEIVNTATVFTVVPVGNVFIRNRQSGDAIRLPGGTKSIKKLFIDRKIPAARRDQIPILCDDAGILGIPGISVNLDRAATELPATRIEFQL